MGCVLTAGVSWDPESCGLPFGIFAFHQVALVVHFHPVGVQPDLHLLADETGGDGVSPTGYPLFYYGMVVHLRTLD